MLTKHDCKAVEGLSAALSGMSKESNMSSSPLMTLRLLSSSPAQKHSGHFTTCWSFVEQPSPLPKLLTRCRFFYTFTMSF